MLGCGFGFFKTSASPVSSICNTICDEVSSFPLPQLHYHTFRKLFSLFLLIWAIMWLLVELPK